MPKHEHSLTRRSVFAGLAAFAMLEPDRVCANDWAAVKPGSRRETDGKARLVAAYPDHLDRVYNHDLFWRDGTVMPWDDGIPNKTFEQKLASASLADQMSLPYRAGREFRAPAPDWDPGRFRNMPFFRKMYGSTEVKVRGALVAVPWRVGTYRGTLPFTQVNAVHEKAAKIVSELSKLPDQLTKFVDAPAGSFSWRPIAGANQLSPHAFGIAVDINTKYSNYWRWDSPPVWKNFIPFEVIDVFERNGFIWGGKWSHYDTMHFEYRPELLTPV